MGLNRSVWEGRAVLVTGHTGFKGSWLCLWLGALGADVTGLSIDVPTEPSLFELARVGGEVRSVTGDVRDFEAVRDLVAGAKPEVVFHMAAQPLVRHSLRDPLGTYSTNVMGTANVLEAVRTVGGVRAAVNVTSDKCYDERPVGRGYREDDPLGGSDPYSSSKGAAELVAAAYRRSFFVGPEGPALASVRAGNVIGGGDWGADRLVPDLVRAALAREVLSVRNPDAVRPWQHVLNALSGYMVVAESLLDSARGAAGAWNFGPDPSDARPVREVVDRLCELWDDGLRWEPDAREHPREAPHLALDSRAAQRQLGWTPAWGLDRALSAVVDWHRAVAAGEDAREVSLGQLAAFAESEGAVATLGRTKRVRRSGEDRCRLCAAPLAATFADLGKSPIANSYPTAEELDAMEPFYPLRARVCGECLLVQVGEFESPSQIFSDYAYFSSYSTSWLEHSGRLAESLTERLELSRDHLVVELASNDGYLLRHFADRGVPVLGIEPAANVAEVAQSRGIPTQVAFFGAEVARGLAAGARADVVLGLNVLAHVPDLNDFVAGVKLLLAETGVAVFEFPHLMRLIEGLQFDTIYHEHFSYLSLLTARRAFARHELELVDVEELPTHGGSLRVHVRHSGSGAVPSPRVEELARREQASGLTRLETYEAFDEAVRREKREIVAFLTGLRREGRRIAGYGAPAKGNTLINYCGIGRETLEYTVDANPAKQGRYLPGSEIPIRPPEELRETRPDVVLILPWNLREEIVAQHGYVREWGGRFAARTPSIALLP